MKRPKSKSEQLRDRQTKKLELNQADLREEGEEKKLLFLDEGASDDDDAPVEESYKKAASKKRNIQSEDSDGEGEMQELPEDVDVCTGGCDFL